VCAERHGLRAMGKRLIRVSCLQGPAARQCFARVMLMPMQTWQAMARQVPPESAVAGGANRKAVTVG